jgi:hypothetical protein
VPATWTNEQIVALAPDAPSVKSGRELANPRKWKTLGQNEQAAWGECQGSAASPYQTEIDLSEPAFHCTCPSHKFPCKHGLGLFLLLAAQPAAFPQTRPPEWVREWLEQRAARVEKKQQKPPARPEKTPDPKSPAKRASDREAKVSAGLAELEVWLRDLVRTGLATVQTQPLSFWETPARRMVDAQAPGVARMLTELSGIPASGAGWQEQLLERLGRLFLLIEAYRRLDTLAPDTREDVRAQIGWTQDQHALLASDGVRARWLVAGQRTEEEERLHVQRTWLFEQGGERSALVLTFAHLSQPLDSGLVPGSILDAELVFFPSAFPLRALIKRRFGVPTPLTQLHGARNIEQCAAAYAKALARQPWLERIPVLLQAVTPYQLGPGYAGRHSSDWFVRDSAYRALPIDLWARSMLRLLALSGGHPVPLCGEWDGEFLMPLSTFVDGRFIAL